jgi:ribosome maturation factor RimP
MYRDISPQLLEVLEPIAGAHGLEIVDATLSGSGSARRLAVVLDTPAGDGAVNIDLCAQVSREIGHSLDALPDLMDGAYTLEVGSPGVDRTLGRVVDFERSVGERVSLETREPLAGRRRFKGELARFADDEVVIEADDGRHCIPFANVGRANLIADLAARSQGLKG